LPESDAKQMIDLQQVAKEDDENEAQVRERVFDVKGL